MDTVSAKSLGRSPKSLSRCAYRLTRAATRVGRTLTRTKRSAVLRRLDPAELYVEVNPKDARQLNVRPNDMVEVSSPRGSITARAFVTNSVRPGQVFLPMHDDTVNELTFPVFDPTRGSRVTRVTRWPSNWSTTDAAT